MYLLGRLNGASSSLGSPTILTSLANDSSMVAQRPEEVYEVNSSTGSRGKRWLYGRREAWQVRYETALLVTGQCSGCIRYETAPVTGQCSGCIKYETALLVTGQCSGCIGRDWNHGYNIEACRRGRFNGSKRFMRIEQIIGSNHI